ncbi:MAG: ATP-dependent helicase, partial [Gammaproteobacteria bacterium]|nr:ATP-dependent helicase [Gammaproteobacteria bacterium]
VYRSYIRLLIEGNHLDFGALLVCCLRLFNERPRIARDYGVVYPFVCVDEYQDTNKVQDFLLRTLYPDRDANLFVVADDDQTIYQWNGASPERLNRLQHDYDMHVVQLPESFRCPPEVVGLANNLIRHNVNRAPNKAPLVSTADSSASRAVRIRRFADCAAELSWVAADIKARSLDPGTCTVLARNTKLVRAAAAALSDAGLPSYVVKRKNEFESPLLRFLHSALRLTTRPGDLEQLAVLCRAYDDLTAARVQPEDAEAESAVTGESLLAGFSSAASACAATHTQSLLDTLRSDLLDRVKYRDFVKNALAWRDSHPRTGNTDSDEETEERSIWHSLSREIRDQLGADPPLGRFLQQIDLRQKTPPPRPTDVQCLTIHMAKGKEFQHVYLTGLAEE